MNSHMLFRSYFGVRDVVFASFWLVPQGFPFGPLLRSGLIELALRLVSRGMIHRIRGSDCAGSDEEQRTEWSLRAR